MSNTNNTILDPTAFSSLIVKEERYIKRFIYRVLYNVEDLEDVYQTTLMEAYKSRHNFRGECSSRVWICGIAKNIVLGWNRKHIKNRNVLVSNEVLEYDEIYSESSIQSSEQEDICSLEETTDAVKTAIGTLGAEFKDIYSEHVLEGVSYKAIAANHDIPVGTVKSRIYSARAHIRRSVTYPQ